MPISINVTLRANKSVPLTWAEGDANWSLLIANDQYLDGELQNKQASNAKLTAIAASVWVANSILYLTGTDTIEVKPATAYGLQLLGYDSASALKIALELNNVSNTSDIDKPVSTAVQVELDKKVNSVSGKGLSSNDYTTAEKTKLAGITTGATANSSDATLLNRANHTGTQLASTISNFAATVRDTIVTGIVFTSSAAVVATDSVLIALGKLQRQITDAVTSIATKANKGANTDITSLAGLTTALSVAQGGTGGNTAALARTGLGLGNAATATVVSSNTDSTAGRVLTVGAHGVGALLPQIQAVDLDALRTSGDYYVLTTNGQGPLPIYSGGYISSFVYTASYAIQVFTNVNTGAQYRRKLIDGVWDATWENLTVKAGVSAIVRKTTNTSIPNNSLSLLAFDDEVFDSGNLVNLATDSGIITVPEDGVYLLSCSSDMAAGATVAANSIANLRVTNDTATVIYLLVASPWAGTSANQMSGVGTAYLTAGTKLRMGIFQNTGVAVSSRATVSYSQYFGVTKIG